MNSYRHTTIAAAGACLLAAAPLSGVFRTYSWLVYAIGSVLAVLAAALLVRRLRTSSIWVQIGGMLGALLLLLTWIFGGNTAILGIIPTPDTFLRFGHLLVRAGIDVRELSAPVPDTDGLMFTIALSIGLVAILLDVIAVGMGQPALAGLPMLAIYSVPVAVLARSVSWFAFGLAAAGYLWLLAADHITRVRRWGRRFADDGRDVDVWEPSPLAAAGRRIGLVGIVAAVLIPLALPGLSTGLLQKLISGAGLASGPGAESGRTVDPIASLKGDLRRPNMRPMLRVYTKDESPGYLRLAVADRLTEQGASPGPVDNSRVVGPGALPGVRGDDNAAVDKEIHSATVKVVDLKQGYLPAFPNTIGVTLGDKGRWYYDDSTSVIWSRATTENGQRYKLAYITYNYKAGQLRQATLDDANGDLMRRYTQIPENKTVRRLVDRLTKDKSTEYDQVLGIYNHFSKKNGFTYSTSVDKGTSGSAVVDFLRNKRGFCQQYAVTMTWMLREAGIPARVAIGFTQGRKESYGFTISNWNAHAWVEVYFPGYGWVPFDPTPSAPVYDNTELPWAPNPYEPQVDTPGVTANPEVSGSAAPTKPGTDPRDRDRLAGGGTGGNAQDPPSRWPYVLLAVVLVLLLLAAPATRRALLRRRRLRLAGRGEPEAAARAAWHELLDTLVDLDVDYQTSDTPRAVARRLTRSRPPLITETATEVGLLATVAERAGYSRQPMHSDRLAEALTAVRAELRTTAVYGLGKLQAAVFPASVIRRWQAATETGVQTAGEAWDRWREGIARRLPRRRLPWRRPPAGAAQRP